VVTIDEISLKKKFVLFKTTKLTRLRENAAMPNNRLRGDRSINTIEKIVLTADESGVIDTYLSMQQKFPLHVAIRQYLIYHDGDLEMTILHKFSGWYHSLQIANPSASVFRLFISSADDEPKTGFFAILPSDKPNIYRLLSVSFSQFWYRAIRRLVKELYPEAMPVYFRQTEIQDALTSFEHQLGSKFRVRIADVTMKGKRENRFYDTERLWTDLSISESFEKALERNLWFASLRFIVQQKEEKFGNYRNIASGRLYKKGEIFYDFYHFEITSYLISVLVDYSAKRFQLLSKRGIRERNYEAGFPLEIYYKDEVFSDLEEIHRFAETIQKYPNATKAVFHGNPYYHASIADFLDGSSFEIWIVSPSRAIIVPQARSSTQAFERLITHILYEFKEGKVNEYTGANE
jgi:hypothetical protein